MTENDHRVPTGPCACWLRADHRLPEGLIGAHHRILSRPVNIVMADGISAPASTTAADALFQAAITAAQSAGVSRRVCHRTGTHTEQLPEQIDYEFTTSIRPHDGRPITIVRAGGTQLGDPLTDAAHEADYYRLHDVFHLSYATLLGWSPVTRALLKRKRRSDPRLDENEDGGRAIVIEEGIVALVFSHAAKRDFLRGHTHIEPCVLDHIREMTAPLEVSTRTAQDWEHTILTGMRLWRQLRSHGGTGTVHADQLGAAMGFTPAVEGPHVVRTTRVAHQTRWQATARHTCGCNATLAG